MEKTKTRPVQFRATEDEYEVILKNATNLGLTVSAYLRLVALHAKVDVLNLIGFQ